MSIGFLHTSPLHVPTFDRLVRELAPQTHAEHLVDTALLSTARSQGSAAVAGAVTARLDELVACGAQVIVCTCSTIGDLAESSHAVVTVMRVDRPMAQEAVRIAGRIGGRIGVVAAVESTVLPTRALLEAEATRLGRNPELEITVAEDAWATFETGDQATYLDIVAASARRLARRSDVIVLAQASMVGALEQLADLSVPVLSSPSSAVRAALHMVTGSAGGQQLPLLGIGEPGAVRPRHR